MIPAPRFHLKRSQRFELCLGKVPNVCLAEVCIANCLFGKLLDGTLHLLTCEPEAGWIPTVELPAVSSYRIHAVSLEFQQHAGDHAGGLRVIFKKPMVAVFKDLHWNTDSGNGSRSFEAFHSVSSLKQNAFSLELR
jgi:hypothetical protein